MPEVSPSTPHVLIVEPFVGPDGKLAHGRMGFGRFNRQEIGPHRWRRTVWPHVSPKGSHLRSIGTDLLQRQRRCRADPREQGVGVSLVGYGCALHPSYRLVVLDRQSNITVAQVLPDLVNADLPPSLSSASLLLRSRPSISTSLLFPNKATEKPYWLYRLYSKPKPHKHLTVPREIYSYHLLL